MLARIARLYRTLRHLKGEQLYFQIYYRVCSMLGSHQPSDVGPLVANWQDWPQGLNLALPCNVDGMDPMQLRCCFINLEHRFEQSINWSGSPHGKLWDYNLHYFEWLWGLDPESAKRFVLDWVHRHPFTKSAVGWEPYPLSLRIMNWLGYWGTQGRALLNEDEAFRTVLFRSLGQQCDWLTKRLEKHLLGNHYLENGVALWIAGRFFEGVAADRWQKIGDAILVDQLGEQILEDGMHFERSPMYHNRILWLLSWLTALDTERFGELHDKAQSAALLLQHPDGRISLFNDSAFGIYPEAQGESPCGSFALKAAGYNGMRTETGDFLICDTGRIGPDYIPGHAHCDIGSFEFTIGGRRFITDTGVFHYIDTDRRHRSRATSAHNTFGPAGVEQAEIWSTFRVGDRPNVSVEQWETNAEGFQLKVSHDGFRKMDVASSRSFHFDDSACLLLITDSYQAKASTRMCGRLHFAPSVSVVSSEGSSVCLNHCGRSVKIHFQGVDNVTIGESEYYPEFNRCILRPCIEYTLSNSFGEVLVRIDWGD